MLLSIVRCRYSVKPTASVPFIWSSSQINGFVLPTKASTQIPEFNSLITNSCRNGALNRHDMHLRLFTYIIKKLRQKTTRLRARLHLLDSRCVIQSFVFKVLSDLSLLMSAGAYVPSSSATYCRCMYSWLHITIVQPVSVCPSQYPIFIVFILLEVSAVIYTSALYIG